MRRQTSDIRYQTSDPHIVISSEERNLCYSRPGGQRSEILNGKPAIHLPSGIAPYILAALPYFYAPHHHFAFLISNFSFNRGFQT